MPFTPADMKLVDRRPVRRALLITSALALLPILAAGCSRDAQQPPAPTAQPAARATVARTARAATARKPGERCVYLVPLGDFPAQEAAELADHFRQTLHIDVETLPAPPRDESVKDPDRHQLIGEALLAMLKAGCPRQADDPNAVLIGLTSGDMYLRETDWRYAYATNDGARASVIATWRMDPASFGNAPEPNVLEARTRKMVMKHIGDLFFHYPRTESRSSVMFSPINGPDDLDSIPERY